MFTNFVRRILAKSIANPKWKCLSCNKEIFEGHFCKSCEDKLPFNDKTVCNHCGRKVKAQEEYCSTCKGVLVDVDTGRSAFTYEEPISTLIKKLKYYNGRYIADILGEYLSAVYFKNYFTADVIVYVPMTKRAEKKRGYNQSKLLAEALAKRVNLPITDCLIKDKETERQATLDKNKRLKNLQDAFKVADKSNIKGKSVVIVDDVTTTGATAQAVAYKLKKAGAIKVYLITVASVSSKDGY